jgi:hypothetical protein
VEPIHVPTLAIRGRVTTVTKKWNKVGSHQELVIGLLRKYCYEQNAMTNKKKYQIVLLFKSGLYLKLKDIISVLKFMSRQRPLTFILD